MDFTAQLIAAAATAALSGLVLRQASRADLREPLLAKLNDEGRDAARKFLDAKLPEARALSLARMNVQAQKQRQAALGWLGETAALRAGLGMHRGLLTSTIQVDAIALLSLALAADDPSDPTRELEELADRGRREGKLARVYAARLVRAFSDAANAFSGKPLPSRSRSMLEQAAMEGGMVELVVLQALRRALEANGDAEGAARVDRRLKVLVPSKP
jgi:hypothetical protein